MHCEAASFCHDLCTDLCRCPVAVFEGVVLVVEFGEPFGQGQLVSVTLVDPEGELPRCQRAGEHATCQGSRGGFLAGFAGNWIER